MRNLFKGEEPGGSEERRPRAWPQGTSSFLGMKGKWTRDEATGAPQGQAGSRSPPVAPIAHPCPVPGTKAPPEHSSGCFLSWTDVEGGAALIGRFQCARLPAASSRALAAQMNDRRRAGEFEEQAHTEPRAVRY